MITNHYWEIEREILLTCSSFSCKLKPFKEQLKARIKNILKEELQNVAADKLLDVYFTINSLGNTVETAEYNMNL